MNFKHGEAIGPPAPVPPYLSYKTLCNFIDSLQVGIPGRIDRSVTTSMSGATHSQLMAALRYLALISSNGAPTERLSKLVGARGTERRTALRELLVSCYPFMFRGFDLQKATTRQIGERLIKAGASGDTVRKCVTFFIAAAKDAEIAVSPFTIRLRGSRGGGSKTKRPEVASLSRGSPIDAADKEASAEEGAPTWSQLLLSKFPSFDPAWPDEVKSKWFDAFDRLMNLDDRRG